ncbi:MAG: YraN family protein [Propionibacteriaceae bacterium]|nr:YraN family protein [Propionibacteriaceae bacterium]
MGNVDVWRAGEDLAATYLSGIGWEVVERNWRCPAGELDIIAKEPGSPPVVVFCEVKCRRDRGFGDPLESITATKVAKLRQLALHWLRGLDHPVPRIRFDGVGILLPRDSPPVITHVRGIGS